MKTTTWLCAALLTAACGEGEAPSPDIELTAAFVGAVGNPLPYADGGALEVELRARIPGITGPTRARVEVLEPLLAAVAERALVFELAPTADSDEVRGVASLHVPQGGTVQLRFTVADAVLDQTFILAVPAVSLAVGGAAWIAGEPRRTVCISSNVDRGTLDVALSGIETLTGAATAELTLVSTPCGDTPGRSYATLTLRDRARPFEVTAALRGTRARAQHVDAAPAPITPPTITFLAPPPRLVSPGALLEVTVVVTVDGDHPIAAGTPVHFSTLPAAELSLDTAETNALGWATTELRVPDETQALLISASVAHVRASLVLR